MKQIISFPAKILEPVRRHLLKQEKKLKKRKEELDKEDPFADADRVNNNAASDTDAAEQVGHARVTALREEVDKGLIRVRKALTKIKIGKYGLCDSCGKMINTDRLAVDPAAQYCVECEKKKAATKQQ